ncbi:ABC-2 family transporter protein [Paenibacillus filicis]|uniref:ABC-2 family transporter protein n=1 Tax=Paenibacillus gyeongsangnamensis TaxID=3388067 RepID=A0ABT4Q787_9BACL|nr:ABC-2 family transporter protein [Paenibacillus filicis]MCZ8512732.1 ABC-2 family transporter protein [Paenibacillus filicis]
MALQSLLTTEWRYPPKCPSQAHKSHRSPLYDFTRYPLEIFHPVLRGLLTYVIPYALGSFFPAAYLLRPHQYDWAAWVVPVSAVGIIAIAYWIWAQGLRRYSSVAG